MIGLILGYVFGGAPFSTTVANPLKCIPTPTSVARLGGAIPMKGIDIVSTNRKLDGIANVLAGDLSAVTDQVITVKTKPKTRSIVLRLTPDGPKESYTIEAKSNITVTAKTPQGISHAAATLLQLIEKSNGKFLIPRLVLNDTPKSSYRGMMIDVARRYHSIDVLKQCVVLCHLYKLNYLQLHLSDDQAFTFPSTAFPKISAQNQHGGPAYTLAQLKDLVRFADDHGVTVVPEMDIPGHSGMLNRTMPDLFKIKGTKPYEHHATINFVNPAVLQAVDKLIGEMCDVFHSSPYFHMGGDEADISLVDQHPDRMGGAHGMHCGDFQGAHGMKRHHQRQQRIHPQGLAGSRIDPFPQPPQVGRRPTHQTPQPQRKPHRGVTAPIEIDPWQANEKSKC